MFNIILLNRLLTLFDYIFVRRHLSMRYLPVCEYYNYYSHDSFPIILLNHLYKDNISNSSFEINLQQQNIIATTAIRVWKKYPLSWILSTPDTKSIVTKAVIHNIIPLIISLNLFIVHSII